MHLVLAYRENVTQQLKVHTHVTCDGLEHQKRITVVLVRKIRTDVGVKHRKSRIYLKMGIITKGTYMADYKR